jgi:murein L,D-transpeptidase YcbB/YkuD
MKGTIMSEYLSCCREKIAQQCAGFFCLFFLVLPVSAQEEAVQNENTLPPTLSAWMHVKQHPDLQLHDFSNRADDLQHLYALFNNQFLWVNTENSELSAVLRLLDNAAENGLNKADYDSESLTKRWQQLSAQGSDVSEEQLARLDTAVSISLLRYLHDLHYGRVNPKGINYNLKLREKKLLDLPVLIKEHIIKHEVLSLQQHIEPQLAQYQLLKRALVQYRKLASVTPPYHFSLQQPVHPGELYPQLAELRMLLMTLADLAVTPTNPNETKDNRYQNEEVTAVKKFQYRHGLAADGVIGASTIAELNTPLARRVMQLELAMERLRWLPSLSSDPSILVNIPAFELLAYENVNDPQASVLKMPVVVGRAMKNQTPVLMASMSFIDFAPYWNVPYKIVKEELLPKLQQNPSFLAHENMELVSSNGVVEFDFSSLSLLKQGTIRIRQRPGKKNALGKVKFLFPNKDDVYLHDTPANALFGRSRRDFSHGCVRVSDPEALALFALRNQPKWDQESIRKAMTSPKMQRVFLKTPIPVLFFYVTAFFDQQNELIFYPDIYEQDGVLQEALKQAEDLSDQLLFASKSGGTTDKTATDFTE